MSWRTVASTTAVAVLTAHPRARPPRPPPGRRCAGRPRSSAASPRAVEPPGEVTSRRTRERVVVARRAAARRCRPSSAVASCAATSGAMPVPHRGVDLRLDDQRHVRRPDAHHGRRDVHQLLRHVHDGRDALRTARRRRRRAPPARRARRRRRSRPGAPRPASFGIRRIDRHARVGRPQRLQRRRRRGSRRRPWRAARPRAATAASCAGLWQSTTTSALPRELGVRGGASPPSSAASAAARSAIASVQSTGSPQPRASARCHVARSDQSDAHGLQAYLRRRGAAVRAGGPGIRPSSG